MATTLPALKGRMGDMDYYLLTLKAGELVRYITFPSKIDGWEDLSLEEKYQRDINFKRVKEQIAPYWAGISSHFFGSIIVAPINFKNKNFSGNFEPVTEIIGKGLPSAYATMEQNIGFLTIPGEILLVPLDGQHRVKAIEFAISGKDEKGNEITGLTPKTALANEDISVLLVAVDTKKARSIFTNVNRYAKPTSAGQNYITSDDDILAVIARKITNKKISARLVKYKTNTLSMRDKEFTTLSTLYNCIDALANSVLSERLDTTRLPEDDIKELLSKKACEVWDILLSDIEAFNYVLQDKEESGDERRIELREGSISRPPSLLARPVTQECLFKAFLELTASPTNFSYTDAVAKLNALPWDLTDENIESIWQNVLWWGSAENGRMITKNRNLASDLIFYLAGGRLDDGRKQKLLEKYQEQFTESDRPDDLPPL